MKCLSSKFMLNLLKLFLIIVLFFLLIRFFSKDVVEGLNLWKKLKKIRKRQRKRRKRRKRRKQRRNKNFQQAIQRNINDVSTGFGNIRNCAVPYNDSLQLGENSDLFKIFGNDKIIQCNGQTPKIVNAKKNKFPAGISLIASSSDATTSHINYGDEVGLCGNSNIYKVTNKVDADSTEKVKYGDNIKMTPVSGSESTSFNVTVNPNVYGISNVKELTSDDFSTLYVTSYSHCADSTSDGTLLAT